MIDRPGIGVMIGMLGGNAETVDAYNGAIGKVIAALSIDDSDNGGDGALKVAFSDGSGVRIYDRGRSCCESRYMQCDDDLRYHVGATLNSIEIRDGGTTEGEYGDEHEIQFLTVTTSKGVFTVATHNEHNGYYGGFWMEVREWTPDD